MQKKLNKFQPFFDVCSGSPVGLRSLKRSVSIVFIKEFNVVGELPVGRRYYKLHGNQI